MSMPSGWQPPSDPELRALVCADVGLVNIAPPPGDRVQRAYFALLADVLRLKLAILAATNGAADGGQ